MEKVRKQQIRKRQWWFEINTSKEMNHLTDSIAIKAKLNNFASLSVSSNVTGRLLVNSI